MILLVNVHLFNKNTAKKFRSIFVIDSVTISKDLYIDFKNDLEFIFLFFSWSFINTYTRLKSKNIL